MVTGKDLFDFVGTELVPLDMENVIIVPVKPRNEHYIQCSIKYIQIDTTARQSRQSTAEQRIH